MAKRSVFWRGKVGVFMQNSMRAPPGNRHPKIVLFILE
jgi:hypothetical protein